MGNSPILEVGKQPVPVCYYPGTILLVDDNAHFLEGLSLSLGFEQVCKTFTSPQLAYQFLLEQYQSPLDVPRYLTKLNEVALLSHPTNELQLISHKKPSPTR